MNFNRTPLHHAIQALEPIEHMIFCDIDAQDCFGLTPLHYAVEFDRVDVACCLMSEHGAKTNLQDIYGDTPLGVARRYYSHLPNHKRMCVTIKVYDRLRRLRFVVRIVAKLLVMYQRSVHRVWKPGGVGYYSAKNDFETQ